MRPFLKWAGGKYKIVNRINSVMPQGKRLVEPFVGAGAVFLNADFEDYLLCDINQDLIDLYQILQAQGGEFIRYCSTLFSDENNDKNRYYEFRVEFNETSDRRRKSALFLYLNRHCFNGLCRYNAKGIFNVPFGTYKKPYFPEVEMMDFHARYQHAKFYCGDFSDVLICLNDGDVVFCDPPYVPLSSTANFTSYSAGKFTFDQHRHLARQAVKLSEVGVPFVICNHDTEFTRAIYDSATITELRVSRAISSDTKNRSKAKELIALFCNGY